MKGSAVYEKNGVKPITPEEAPEMKMRAIPEFVIKAFNELIAETYSYGGSTFPQEAVVERILKAIEAAGGEETRADIFDQGWLDVEDIYRVAGWTVTYSKPGYNETGIARFSFSAPARKR